MTSHSAIAATSLGVLDHVQLPTPVPGEGEILVEVKFAALSPVDTYQVDHGRLLRDDSYPHVPGLAGAGFVKKLGAGVTDLKEGDRVAAFTYGPSKRRPLQEYCIVPRTLVAKVPESYPLEEAAALPDNYQCAMYTIFSSAALGLPLDPPYDFPASSRPTDALTPILVYGAGSSSGQFMVEVLSLAGYKNIIAVASLHHRELLESFGATSLVDYRDDNLAESILKATGGASVPIVIDCICVRPFMKKYAPALSPGARVALLMPVKEGSNVVDDGISGMHFELPDWTTTELPDSKPIAVYTFRNQDDPVARDYFMPKILPELLEKNAIRPNPTRIFKEGPMTDRVREAFDLLRSNKVSGQKLVIGIDF